jgi:hypothetical protein
MPELSGANPQRKYSAGGMHNGLGVGHAVSPEQTAFKKASAARSHAHTAENSWPALSIDARAVRREWRAVIWKIDAMKCMATRSKRCRLTPLFIHNEMESVHDLRRWIRRRGADGQSRDLQKIC